METRVTYRTSQETVQRLQELSDKYGVSQSALLTMLVNQRWLAESNLVKKADPSAVPEPPKLTVEEYARSMQPQGKKRKRH